MTGTDRLARLPDWPARMTAPVAAAYMGVSQTTFLARFGPHGRKEGGNTLWARAQLDRIVAEQFDLAAPTVALPAEDELERWRKDRRKA